MKKNLLLLVVPVCGCIILTGCATPMGHDEAVGTGVGAVVGGIAGGVIGHNVGDGNNEAIGAAMGAALGGMGGREIGRGKDIQENRMKALEQQANTTTINITNSNGSFTPVTLQKLDGGRYRGPKGEIYPTLPTSAQLKSLYGL